MKTKRLLMILAGLVFTFSGWAQEMPAAQQNLMKFIGNWQSTDIQLNLGGETYGGVYSFNCEPVNDNTGIVAHEKFVNDEMGTMLAENLLGYDPNLGQVHLYTIDNMGTAHDHYGYWVDDNHLFLEYQGVVEGHMYVEQLDMVFADANTIDFTLTSMMNGELFERATGTFKK